MLINALNAATLANRRFTQCINSETVIVQRTLTAIGAEVIARARAEKFIGAAAVGTLLLRSTHFAGVLTGGKIAGQHSNAFWNIPDDPVVP